MLIYEVNFTVDEAVATEYSTWLREHIREMLKLDGFEAAAWYTRSDGVDAMPTAPDDAPTGTRHWTVHYQVASREDLQRYFDAEAESMRQDSQERFGNQFSAERRILEQTRTFSRHSPDRQSPGR
jgi:hypothetical protein